MSPRPEPDPDRLLQELQRAAGVAPLPPLTLAAPSHSARRGPIARIVDAVRGRLLAPVPPMLLDLVDQLERDRQRLRGEIDALNARVLELERGADPPPPE